MLRSSGMDEAPPPLPLRGSVCDGGSCYQHRAHLSRTVGGYAVVVTVFINSVIVFFIVKF